MTTLYNSETFETAYTATGVVREVEKFLGEADRAALLGQPRPRAYDDAGHPLVDVELVRKVINFGQPATEIIAVRMAESPETKSLQPGPVRFSGLAVEVYANKNGRLVEHWKAASVLSAASTRRAGESA